MNAFAKNKCGVGAASSGVKAPWELPKDVPGHEGKSAADQQATRLGVAQSIEEMARQQSNKGIGNVPAGLRAWVQQTLRPPQVDYRRVLRDVVKRSIWDVKRGGSDHRVRVRPSRIESGNALPARLPTTVDYVPSVSLVLDTSGSMSGRPIYAALSEVAGVLQAQKREGAKISVFCADARAYERQFIKDIGQLEVVGGGGTDMTAGIVAAAVGDKKTPPDVVVLLTDGYVGAWPERVIRNARGKVPRMVVVLVNGNYDETPGVEKFVARHKGKLLRVDPKEL